MIQKLFFGFLMVAACFGLTAQGATFYVSAGNTNAAWPYADWSTAAGDIQTAVDAASTNDVVLVTNGLYATGAWAVNFDAPNRVVLNKALTLRSVNGPEVTVIQGNPSPVGSGANTNNVRGVYMKSHAVLNGFSVTGGYVNSPDGDWDTAMASYGGGVFCESTNSILTNCILSGNACISLSRWRGQGGGAVYQGTLLNCILTNNTCTDNADHGGGALLSVLSHCLIISNSATFGGGAAESILDHCSVIGNCVPGLRFAGYGGGTYGCMANHCSIVGNRSAAWGGGDCDSFLTDCVISNNSCIPPAGSRLSSVSGGGCYVEIVPSTFSEPMPTAGLINCLVVSNVCIGTGGGIYFKTNGSPSPGQSNLWSTIVNCTIIGNASTNYGCGLYQGRATNCIIYGNVCPFPTANDYFLATVVNCWTNDPQFVNPATGDYHLSSTSPCINAGVNMAGAPATDLDDNPRIAGSRVDIGCYEYQSPASILPYAWLEQYNLPTDGSADYADTDGTGMNNWQKWIAGLNPTNPASLFIAQPLAAVSNPSGITVTWQSVNIRSYFIQRTPDLSQPFATGAS